MTNPTNGETPELKETLALVSRNLMLHAKPIFAGFVDEAIARLEALESRALSAERERDEARADAVKMRVTLQGIANANYHEWDAEMAVPAQFVAWAKSRARHTLESTTAGADILAERDELKRQVEGKWTRDLPNEQGLWWWWNEDEDSAPIIVHIFYSGTDGTYFAPEGQYGWTRFQPCSEMGGCWMRQVEPEAPQPLPPPPAQTNFE